MIKHRSVKTLPVGIFQEVLATGNLSLLGNASASQLETVWASIFDEYIAEIGLSESYKSYMRHMAKAIEHYKKAYVDGHMWHISFAEVEKAKAKAEIGDGAGTGFPLLVAQVSKFMGFRVDPNKTPVVEFYSYIKLMENGIREGKN